MPRLALDLAAFGARYRNLIVEKKNLGTAQPGVASADNPTLFQTVNVDRARISGIEFKGVWRWGRVLQGELGSPFAYGRAWGADAGTGRPLGAIDPARLHLGLSYEAASWDLRLDLVHRAAKEPGELLRPSSNSASVIGGAFGLVLCTIGSVARGEVPAW